MVDIFHEVDDALRQEKLEKTWKRYGSVIIACAVGLVIFTGGYHFYKNWDIQNKREQTAVLLDAIEKNDTTGLSQIVDGKLDGAVLLAPFFEADLHAKNQDFEAALASLKPVLTEQSVPDLYREFAVILEATYKLELGQVDGISKKLQPLSEYGKPWRYSAQELMGLLAVQEGDLETAQEIFSNLAQDSQAPGKLRQRAQKLSSFYSPSKS